MAPTPKRKRQDDEDAVKVDGAGVGANGSFDEEVELSLLEQAEKEAQVVEALDVRALRRMILSFEKKLKENMEARMKYIDQPSKFVETEVELDDEVKRMKVLSAAPELYTELVRLNVVSSILGLLSHENTDIAIDAVELLNDLTDSDAVGDNDEEVQALIDSMIDNNVLELLVQNLARLDESVPDEAAAVYNTLSIMENMVEAKPEVAEAVCEKTKLLRWLLNRLRGRDFDSNKFYASEILAILMQDSTTNQRRMGQLEGVDALLKAVALFKSRDPRTTEEEEMLENLYDALCSVLLPAENKERFVKSEGVELMIIIIKQKRQAYYSALRTLDFALTDCSSACERFVDVLGLKTLFSAFTGKVHVKTKKRDISPEEVDERAISMAANLLSRLSRGTRRDRVLSKFVEKEFEKIDRLMELFLRYWDRVQAEERRQQKQLPGDILEDMDEDARYLVKLDAGLFALQQLALILGHLWAAEHGGMRRRILLLLQQHGMDVSVVRNILSEYEENLGDADGADVRDRRRTRVQKLIKAMIPPETTQS